MTNVVSQPVDFGCHCWLVQQCEAVSRYALLDETSSGTRSMTRGAGA